VVLLSFVYWAFHYDKRKRHHFYLLMILALGVVNEALSTILSLYGLPFKLTCSFYNVAHCALWLWILGLVSGRYKTGRILIVSYLFFCTLDFIWLEPGFYNFKAYSLTAGAFLYTMGFMADSTDRLKKEELSYFSANAYTLLSAPILFFIGFSLLLGFKTRSINEIKVYGDITFYRFVCYFVNTVYYTVLAVFMYREKKQRHAT